MAPGLPMLVCLCRWWSCGWVGGPNCPRTFVQRRRTPKPKASTPLPAAACPTLGSWGARPLVGTPWPLRSGPPTRLWWARSPCCPGQEKARPAQPWAPRNTSKGILTSRAACPSLHLLSEKWQDAVGGRALFLGPPGCLVVPRHCRRARPPLPLAAQMPGGRGRQAKPLAWRPQRALVVLLGFLLSEGHTGRRSLRQAARQDVEEEEKGWGVGCCIGQHPTQRRARGAGHVPQVLWKGFFGGWYLSNAREKEATNVRVSNPAARDGPREEVEVARGVRQGGVGWCR